ncbi:MAG: enoyl-CoA hydratase/isomerase family protein [Sphingobium sp.]
MTRPPEHRLSTPVLRVMLSDGILWLTKRDPARRNGISLAMADALMAAIEHARGDPQVRAVVLDAEGGFHGSAVLVMELADTPLHLTPEDFARIEDIGHGLGDALWRLDKPVIGVAGAGALGGGLELLMRCDFVYCTDGAQFRLPEVNFGFVAAWGGTQFGGRLLALRRAQEMLLLGDRLDGRQAAAEGLVTGSFTDKDALDRHIGNVLTKLRQCSPASLAGTKRALRALWERPLSEGLTIERQSQMEALATGDFRLGLQAAAAGMRYDFTAQAPVPRN